MKLAVHRCIFLIWLGMSCVLMLSFSGCGERKSNQLVIGMELSYPPFEMTDAQNQPSGIGVEMARALAESLHKELVIQNTQFEGLIPSLQTGKIDLIISSMTANEERSRSIDFSVPYIRTGICVLLTAKSDIQSAEDLNKPGRKIVVKSGTTGYLYARDHLKNAEILQIPEESACALEIVQSKADAFIYDQMSIYQFHKKYPDSTRAILTPIQHEDWAVGIRKGNDALRTQVNTFIEAFKAKHALEAIGAKYINDKEAFKEMGYPFS